jgi:hypothetical protein
VADSSALEKRVSVKPSKRKNIFIYIATKKNKKESRRFDVASC